MGVLEKFIDLVKIDSPSDPASPTCPSTAMQLDVANHLERVMKEMGISNVRQQDGYVYGEIPATPGYEDKTPVGFIAHMDTAPEFNGIGVKPQVIENYDGGDVLLKGSGHILSPEEYPVLRSFKGHTLITTDGTTLLGSDDKAGIAEILEAAEILLQGGIPHGKVCLGFTPDEEIGRGPLKFDVAGFGAKLAYTLDGGAAGSIEYENFNADQAEVTVKGYSIHPGSAKDKMKNSQTIAMEFDRLLPAAERPQYTEGYEGFYHMTDIHGGVEETHCTYILRDHDSDKLQQKKENLGRIAAYLNGKWGEGTVQLKIKDSYRNMKEMLAPHMEIVDKAREAFEACGVTPSVQPIRGGTDGARLSYMGLLCPNLSTGGYNCHGRKELITVQALEKMTQVLLEIVKRA